MYFAEDPAHAEAPDWSIGGFELVLILIGIVFVLGIVLTIVYFGVLRKKNNPAQISGNNIIGTIPRPSEQFVKRCPACNSTFTDKSLNFCLSDGTPLEIEDENETVIRKA